MPVSTVLAIRERVTVGRRADHAWRAAEDAGARKRIAEMLTLMTALSSWGDEMLRLEPATLMKVMKLGARIQSLVRKTKVSKAKVK